MNIGKPSMAGELNLSSLKKTIAAKEGDSLLGIFLDEICKQKVAF